MSSPLNGRVGGAEYTAVHMADDDDEQAKKQLMADAVDEDSDDDDDDDEQSLAGRGGAEGSASSCFAAHPWLCPALTALNVALLVASLLLLFHAQQLQQQQPVTSMAISAFSSALNSTPAVPAAVAAAALSCPPPSSWSPVPGFRVSAVMPVRPGRALITMVLLYSSAFYRENAAYFIDKAIRCWQDADYRIIVQREDAHTFDGKAKLFHEGLPDLPANARYVLHQNDCYDWGTFGYLLNLPESHPDFVDTAKYRYFAMLNTGVRGPVLSDELEARMDRDHEASCSVEEADRQGLVRWYDFYLSMLNDEVRYSGPTLNCGFAAHIQSYAVFFDFVAMQLLWKSRVPRHYLNMTKESDAALLAQSKKLGREVEKDGSKWQQMKGVKGLGDMGPVFGCYHIGEDVIMQSEVGSSQAIVRAGYNIATNLRVWHEVDFRDPAVCRVHSNGLGWDAGTDPMHFGVPFDRNMWHEGDVENRPMTTHVVLDPTWVGFAKYKGHDPPAGSQSYWRLRALMGWEKQAAELRRRKNHTMILP